MAIDIASIINQLTSAAQNDASIVDKLESNPIALIEKLTGIDLPDEMLQPILAGFQSNLGEMATSAQAAGQAAVPPAGIAGLASSLLATEGLDVDGDGDVDLDDLKAGILGSLL